METSKTYHEQKYIDNTLRLRSILETLPAFAKDYFRAVEPTTSARTRISYAYDIRVFFHFLMENNPVYKNYTIDQFTLHDLERLEPVDIEEYQEYLKVYENDEKKQITNTEKGLARKMSALRSFYSYFYKRQAISKNPTLLVDMPKLHEKAIIRLDTDEVAKLLDYVEHGGDNRPRHGTCARNRCELMRKNRPPRGGRKILAVVDANGGRGLIRVDPPGFFKPFCIAEVARQKSRNGNQHDPKTGHDDGLPIEQIVFCLSAPFAGAFAPRTSFGERFLLNCLCMRAPRSLFF